MDKGDRDQNVKGLLRIVAATGGREEMDVESRVRVNPLQHIDEIEVGIESEVLRDR